MPWILILLLTACRSVVAPLVAVQPSPVPVTPTIAPTPTRDPSRLPNGKLRITPEIAAYLKQASSRLKAYGKASASFEAHVKQAVEKPALFADAGWHRQALTYLREFEATGTELGTIAPVPAAVKDIDDWFKLIDQATHRMISDYADAVAEGDGQSFRTAATREEQIGQWIEEALAQLKNFGETPEIDTRQTDL
jgi:hypothetical protein